MKLVISRSNPNKALYQFESQFTAAIDANLQILLVLAPANTHYLCIMGDRVRFESHKPASHIKYYKTVPHMEDRENIEYQFECILRWLDSNLVKMP